MGDIKFTPSQDNAVKADVCDLLVSAAAGSGKTAVLTGRLVREMCDENIDITKMLIVTYTKAAASGLRAKISKAITDEIGKQPNNKNLRAQLGRLERAQISTIHSFCYDVVRKNFSNLGLPAQVRIGDPAEVKLLSKNVMDKTVSFLYENDPDFEKFVNNYSLLLDDSICKMLIGIYTDMTNLKEGIGFVKRSYEELATVSEDYANNKYYDYTDKCARCQLTHYKTVLQRIYDDAQFNETEAKICSKAFEYMIKFIDGYLSMEKDKTAPSEICAYIKGYSAPNIAGRGINEDYADFKKRCADLKKEVSDTIRSLTDKYDLGRFKDECKTQAFYIEMMYRALFEFEKRFSKEKKLLGILDYQDLERMTLSLLTDENGKPNDRARSISLEYERIYIDEYQDVNEVQDAIFSAISMENRFMVGDIKQSIYAFRGAEPSLFSHYRDSFKDFDKNTVHKDGTRVFLSENFRSDATIIDFANMVFDKLFNNNSGTIPYLKEDALLHAKSEDEGCVKPEIVLIEKDDGALTEENYVCNRIKDIIDSGVNPSEIAILARNNDFLDECAKILSKLGISSKGRGQTSIFSSPDVLLMLCILNCIDNPNRDIYLAGALKSPVYGFTMSELAQIREEYRDTSLYNALSLYTEAHGYEKGKAFIKTLNDYRSFAQSKSSDKIIWNIICTSAIRASAAYNKLNKAALEKFYDIAAKYERNSFKGLHSFIGYMNSLMEKQFSGDDSMMINDDIPSEESVRLMTVHQSKGLEYKYVFLCAGAKRLSLSSLKPDVLYEKDLGISTKIRDDDGVYSCNTYTRSIIYDKIRENMADEEMRVLYVALTRPRMSLIVTFCDKEIEKVYEQCRSEAKYTYQSLLLHNYSFMKWIIYSLDDPRLFTRTITSSVEYKDQDENTAVSAKVVKPVDSLLNEKIMKRLEFVYPTFASSKVPTKLSVSKLKPDILDDDGADTLKIEESDFMVKPSFMENSVKSKASDRGVATHLFMQFCDFENVKRIGVKNEAQRLVSERFITREIASIIYYSKLESFFKSNLYKEIASAKSVLREKRFNTRLKASEFTQNEEYANSLANDTVLVQGVIDCLIVKNDESLKLIDYKTDYVDVNDAESENILRERYRTQLSYYRKAIERVTGKRVGETVIYSFSLCKEIVID